MNHTEKMIRALETEKTAQQLNWLYGQARQYWRARRPVMPR